MEITYYKKGKYLLPNLKAVKKTTIGKYGQMRLNYLKQEKEEVYLELMLTGKLENHLKEIDSLVMERVQNLTLELAKAEGMQEEWKNSDPLRWTGLMKNYQAAAEEAILPETIYN